MGRKGGRKEGRKRGREEEWKGGWEDGSEEGGMGEWPKSKSKIKNDIDVSHSLLQIHERLPFKLLS